MTQQIDRRNNKKQIRWLRGGSWVPDSTTGEEVYSLAIVLREAMDEAQANPKVQIFGTDIDTEAIDAARNGRYPANLTVGLSPERLKRFFVREGNTVRVKKEIREMALFAIQNVIKDPPFTRLDLICCRNLLIYLDGDLQKRLVPLFHYVLNPGRTAVVGIFRDHWPSWRSVFAGRQEMEAVSA